MQEGEIWWARVRYDDHPEQSKDRPVLVISSEANSDGDIACLKITSKGKKGRIDYTIPNWKELGLKKESTIRITSGIREISPKDFIEKVNKLPPPDIRNVRNLLEKHLMKKHITLTE